MAQKSNIRSMRFSDEILKLIEAQPGETFTAKFENLVTKCVQELPQKEKELRGIQERINEERQNLRYIQQTKRKVEEQLRNIEYSAQCFNSQLKRVTEALEKIET